MVRELICNLSGGPTKTSSVLSRNSCETGTPCAVANSIRIRILLPRFQPRNSRTTPKLLEYSNSDPHRQQYWTHSTAQIVLSWPNRPTNRKCAAYDFNFFIDLGKIVTAAVGGSLVICRGRERDWETPLCDWLNVSAAAPLPHRVRARGTVG